jgi:hypothetical protein
VFSVKAFAVKAFVCEGALWYSEDLDFATMRWLRTAVLVAAAAPVTGAFRLVLNPSSRCPSRSVSRQQLGGSSAGIAVVAEQESSTRPESTSLSLHEEIATTARGDGVAKLRKAACAAQVARAAAGGSERVRRAVAGGGGAVLEGEGGPNIVVDGAGFSWIPVPVRR